MLAATVILSWNAVAQVADYGIQNGILSFEESHAPVIAGKGSSLSVSDWHAKLGNKSLKWDWKRRWGVLPTGW